MIKKRTFSVSRVAQILFILQAFFFFLAGSGLLLMMGSKHSIEYISWIENLQTPICIALMFAFGVGSSLAIRSWRWREIELLIQMQIALYTTAAAGLIATIFIAGMSAALLVSLLFCAGIGWGWIRIYFNHRKEVRGPGINIKEF